MAGRGGVSSRRRGGVGTDRPTSVGRRIETHIESIEWEEMESNGTLMEL